MCHSLVPDKKASLLSPFSCIPFLGLAQEHGSVLLGFKLFSFPSQGPLKYICLSLYLSSFSLINAWDFSPVFQGLFRYGSKIFKYCVEVFVYYTHFLGTAETCLFSVICLLRLHLGFSVNEEEKNPNFFHFRKLSGDSSDGVVSYTGVLMDFFHEGEMPHTDKAGSEHQTEDIEQKRGDG